MDKNRKLSMRSICAKFQNFEGLSKQFVCIIGLPLVKFHQDQTIIGGKRAKKPQKEPFHGC